MQAIKGKITFEHVDPDDLASVAGSIAGRGGQNVYVGPPGAVDQQLAWALADLKLARNAINPVDRDRCATNAIMSARRSLAWWTGTSNGNAFRSVETLLVVKRIKPNFSRLEGYSTKFPQMFFTAQLRNETKQSINTVRLQSRWLKMYLS